VASARNMRTAFAITCWPGLGRFECNSAVSSLIGTSFSPYSKTVHMFLDCSATKQNPPLSHVAHEPDHRHPVTMGIGQ
jgi:hypothetical protein